MNKTALPPSLATTLRLARAFAALSAHQRLAVIYPCKSRFDTRLEFEWFCLLRY